MDMPSLSPSDTMTTFIGMVRDLMRSECITVRELAERCNMEESAMSRLLSGKSGSGQTRTLDRIAEALGMRLEIKLEKK